MAINKHATRLTASAAVIVMALGLVQCTPTTGTDAGSSASTAAPASTVAPSSASTSTVAIVDTPYAYDVAVTFTPAATARMHALSEQVTLNATYYGDANPGTSGATPAGQIMLGSDSRSMDATSQTVHLTGASLDASHLPSVTGGQPSMLITVASNAGTQNNVLNCDLFQDKVSTGQSHGIALTCDAVS